MDPSEPHRPTRPPAPADGPSPSRRSRCLAGTVLAGVMAVGGLALTGSQAGAIVAGDPTPISEAAWQVSIQDEVEGHLCGGAIVSPTVVATAAHCTVGFDPTELTVRAGVDRHSDDGGQDRAVTRIMEHPDGDTGSSDLALLVLEQPLEPGPTVQPVGIATPEELEAASTGRFTGWGVTSEEAEELTDELHGTEVPLMDDLTCSRAVEEAESELDGGEGDSPDDGTSPMEEDLPEGSDGWIDAPRELCADGSDGGSCYGDSGGGLTITGADGSPKLAGIVSWGIECGDGPEVYTEVPAFTRWIEQGLEAAGTGGAHPDGEDRLPYDPEDWEEEDPEWDEEWDEGWDEEDGDLPEGSDLLCAVIDAGDPEEWQVLEAAPCEE